MQSTVEQFEEAPRQKLRVLVLEDTPADAELLERELHKLAIPLEIEAAATRGEFGAALQKGPDLIISDYQLPQFDGLSALQMAREKFTHIPFIIVTGAINEETAVECMKAGASDYVIKEHLGKLGPSVLEAMEKTALRRKKDDAEHETKRWTEVFGHASWGIAISNLDSQCLELLNPQFAQMHGYGRGELLGGSLFDICAPEVRRNWKERLSLFDELGHETFESVNRKKNGSLFPVLVKLSVVSRANGRTGYLIANIQDISKLKQTEVDLRAAKSHLESRVARRTIELETANRQLAVELMARQMAERETLNLAERLRKSNRELEQFAYLASHDLKEPLRTISSYVTLLVRRYEGTFDREARDFASYAIDATIRMKTLIDELLGFSVIGKKGESKADVDCHSIVQQALNDLRVTISETNAEIVVEALPTIHGVRSQLSQLFQNLISNALKYRKLETPQKILISALKSEEGWLFSVKDNGIGIDPRGMDRIFLMFHRLHSRGESSGTGIGLALCKKVVENHGGRIWAESEAGSGSTFYFCLPESKPSADSRPSSP